MVPVYAIMSEYTWQQYHLIKIADACPSDPTN